MRLQKKEEEELAEREGLAKRTVIQVVWLIISFAIAYYLVTTMVDQKAYDQIYASLSIPAKVPTEVILAVLMFAIVIIMQFILFMAFAFSSPEGRRNTGDASLHSRRKDPFDRGY